MKTNNLFTLPLMALAATALTSCWDDDAMDSNAANRPDPNKTLVAFSSQDGQVGTRAYMEGTRAGLHKEQPTKVVMRIKSEDTESGTAVRFTRTVMRASKEQEADHETTKHHLLEDKHSDLEYAAATYYRYWDDAFGRYAKLSVYAVAVPGYDEADVLADGILKAGTEATQVSATNTNWFTETSEDNTCKWTVPTTAQTTETNAKYDLCYSNNIQEDGEKGVYKFGWTSGNEWKATELTDGNMIWRPKEAGSTSGKFDEGNLIFKHALCKVTINLTEEAGFNNTDPEVVDFNFKSGTNVQLLNFPYHGTLDVASGKWTINPNSTADYGIIQKLQDISDPKTAKTVLSVTGLTLPDKEMLGSEKNALHFVIDDNDYYVTDDQIAKAIRKYYTDGEGKNDAKASEYKYFHQMTQGQHYVINIKVSKTMITNITAKLVAWETVNSENIIPSNAYIQVDLESRDGKHIETLNNTYQFDLYRKASEYSLQEDLENYVENYNAIEDYDWEKTYESAKASKTYKDNVWNTGWYWPNNETYYHLRAIGDYDGTESSTKPVPVADATADYFKIFAGDIKDETTKYKDYIWGAPFTKMDADAKFEYSTADGFNKQEKDANNKVTSSQIYKAIGAVDYEKSSIINMMFFHMTSQVFFNVQTTMGDSQDKVALQLVEGEGENKKTYDTTVELLRVYKEGTVLMGTGKVAVSGTRADKQEIEFVKYSAETTGTTPKSALAEFQYGMVPQTLKGDDYTVGVRITTPDKNQYVIEDISTVKADVITSNHLQNPYNADKVINYWYPGYKYYYNVKIVKTGIVHITAQLVDWETVTGDLGEITLEGTN